MFIFNYSEENLDYELDPLHFEPKRIRKKQDKHSCSQCKYCAKKKNLKKKTCCMLTWSEMRRRSRGTEREKPTPSPGPARSPPWCPYHPSDGVISVLSFNYHPSNKLISVLIVNYHTSNGVISVLSVHHHPCHGVFSVLSVNYHPSDEVISVLSINYHPSDGVITN